MKSLDKILVPTDLSGASRRGLRYACALAIDQKAAVVVVHVANEFGAWELYPDEFSFTNPAGRAWPIDRVLSEASLELNRFLEPHLDSLKNVPAATKRVVLGPIPQQIVAVAEEEHTDLIVMSPHRRALRHLLGGSITDRVTRISPCPVLAVTHPLPSRPWRGKLVPALFGWPRQKAATF